MIKVEAKPENRDEIRRVVDIRCAEQGISRSTYAVKTLQVSPHLLNFMLSGRIRAKSHPEIMRKVSKFAGVTDATAWER